MNNIYIPPSSITLDLMPAPQIRLGIQGAPKTGKTTSALTFPNVIALNLDRGLGGHRHRKDVYEVPFWDPEFIKKITPKDPSKKEALLIWLNKEATKLTNEQTLLVDGNTGIQNAYELWIKLNPFYTNAGNLDDFAPWRAKIEYYGEICELFKSLKCHVVFLCHETPDRDKKGDLNGKLRPMLTGQFGDQLASHFTDWFRQHSYEKCIDFKSIDDKGAKAIMDKYGMTVEEFKAMNDSFTESRSLFVWQTQQDNLCNAASSSLVGNPRFIKADYNTFTSFIKK